MGSLDILIESIKETFKWEEGGEIVGHTFGRVVTVFFCCNLECLSMSYACVMCPMLLMLSFEYVCALL